LRPLGSGVSGSAEKDVIAFAAIHEIHTVAALKRVIPRKPKDVVIAAQSGKQVVPCRAFDVIVVVIGDGDQLTPDLAPREIARMDIEVEIYRRSHRGRTELTEVNVPPRLSHERKLPLITIPEFG
jgi:hypothetical protein